MKLAPTLLVLCTFLFQYSLAQQVDSIDLEFMGLELKKVEFICTSNLEEDTPINIKKVLMDTEKEAQILDVNFSIQDEPISNGIFVFGIETEDSKEITLKLFDEKSFALVVHCRFDIEPGNNYKAIKMDSLVSGSYIIQLKDSDGKELTRTLIIQDELTVVNLIDVELMGQLVKATIICVSQQSSNTDETSADDIMSSLLAVEKGTPTLDVKFLMQDDPITNGLVIFGIESEDMKELLVELYDEEGFAIVVDCSFHIEIGSNYNAINVAAIDSGEYIIIIKDHDGKKIIRSLTINNKED